MSLENKVALVTGGSSGIGAAIAITFSKEGAKVAIVGRNETKLKNVREQCEKVGGKPLVIVADVAKDEDVKKIINTTISNFGKLDILVNNAGIGGVPTHILAENALQVFDQIMSVNMRAVVHLTNLAGPHLVASAGNIINVSSVAGIGIISQNSSAYSASKAALDHFTRCVALDLASKGVRCNVVNPGPVRTDILEWTGMDKDVLWDSMKKYTPLNRVSEPEEVADLALFLASDKAKGITGSTFVTDNGILLKGAVTDDENTLFKK